MRIVIVLCAALLSSCAAKSESRVFGIPTVTKDNLQSEAFIVEYKNTGRKTVCLTPDNWPNSAGKIDQASSRVWVDAGGARYNLQEFNTGYCPQCATKVRVGETVTSKIPYLEFGIPPHLYGGKKALHFEPTGFFCK